MYEACNRRGVAMSRFVKLLTLSFAAGAVVLTTARPAAAQLAWIRPAYPGFQPWIYRTQYSGMFFPSPTGGYGFYTQHQYYSSSPLTTYLYNPGIMPGAYSYGSASALTGIGQNLAGREQLALQQAQRDARNDAAARQQIFDQWAYERGSKRIDSNAPKSAPEGLRPAVLTPSAEDLTSGKALNELLAAIQGLEGKGAKAEAPFLPPDSVARIVFAGGPAADALNLFRSDRVDFPAALRGPEYDDFRAAIEHDIAEVAAQVRAGKKVDPMVYDRLSDNARKLKLRVIPAVRGDLVFDDATAAIGFVNRLEATAKFLKSTGANGLFVSGWQTIGVALNDLTKYMGRFKLQFGPVASGDEGVYAALHRGMVGYYAQLSQPRR
jgi:hypothetical protein